MDALSAILDAIQLKSMVYEKATLCAPWGIEVPQDNNSQFWRLERGRCYLKIPGMPAVNMQEGDLIFVPNGSAHWIADNPDSKRVPSPKYVASRVEGKPMFMGNGAPTVLVGGHFEWDTKLMHPFLNDLPKLMHIKALKQEENSWLKQNSLLLVEELSVERPGSRMIVSRLAEMILVYIIRAYMEQADDAHGFLMALKDERISKALQVMQEMPEQEWTIAGLAKRTGMSRTLFFNQFKKLVGDTPKGYLASWRVLKAKELLAVSNENISEIAAQVGYQSEAAFNRIFKKKTGKAPGAYRRERNADVKTVSDSHNAHQQ